MKKQRKKAFPIQVPITPQDRASTSPPVDKKQPRLSHCPKRERGCKRGDSVDCAHDSCCSVAKKTHLLWLCTTMPMPLSTISVFVIRFVCNLLRNPAALCLPFCAIGHLADVLGKSPQASTIAWHRPGRAFRVLLLLRVARRGKERRSQAPMLSSKRAKRSHKICRAQRTAASVH